MTHSLWPNMAHGLYVWACAAGQRHSSAQRPTLTPGPCPEHSTPRRNA